MKKLSMKFLMMTGLIVAIFFACNDDDDEPPILAPTVSNIEPDSGPVGQAVTLTGLNFGSDPIVRFGTVQATTSNVTTTSITTSVPTGAPVGDLQVTVENDGSTSGGIDFEVTEATTGGPTTPTGPPAISAAVLDTLAGDSLVALSDALEATNLYTALTSAEEVTIFAPSSVAFDSLISQQGGGATDLAGLVAALTREGVAGILQAHVIGDSLPSGDLEETEYETLNDGSTITISVEDGNVFANGAQVLTTDLEIANGVVHIIDSVININANAAATQQTGVVRVASSEEGVGTTTWTASNTYILDGFVYVNEGQTLTIEPGTVIKGRPGQAARASALIVAQGGMIMAEGTAAAPIIFTAEADDLEGSVAPDARGLWGGVIVLGNAPTNNNDVGGVKNIEGIPTDEERGAYGGDDAADNSGMLSYISIRHGGSVIGANNEINGLTLGGVGSGTTINNVEVWANLDDGIEFFGGTVNANNLVVAYAGDDGLDADEGYSGNVQNAIVWQTSATLRSSDPRAMELDGGVDVNENAQPYSTPIFANLTLVYDEGENDVEDAFIIRDNSSASIYNSIIANHDAPAALERRSDLDEGEGEDRVGGSSYDRYVDGTLVLAGNIFYNVNGVTDPANFADVINLDNEGDATLEGELDTNLAETNSVLNPMLGDGTSRFTPTAGATENLATLPEEAGLTALTYRGAVDPSAASPYFANWSKTWAIIGQ